MFIEVRLHAQFDPDEVPLCVGQSTNGISARVRRHPISARSDVIANRQIDVLEIAFVWAWPMPERGKITALESRVFHECDDASPLVNGKVPPRPEAAHGAMPDRVRVQIMEDAEIAARREPALRFPRQIQHFGALVDYILNTQAKPHLRRAVQVYFDRLEKYHQAFAGT